MSEPLRLLTVHAHPDDESSKGAATVARYVDEGAIATLVCCTGGEEGEVLNAAMRLDHVQDRLPEVRDQELSRAAEIIGYQRVERLGYRDSGMPDTPSNEHPDAFWQAPFDDVVDRLVAIVQRDRPHVLIGYPDEHRYRHPDHVRAHEICLAAWERCADEDWTPLKLYYTAWSRARIEALHAAFLRLEMESPYDERWFEGDSHDHRITTRVDIGPWYERRCEALRAHATQIEPHSPFWFGLPVDVAREAYPWDDYVLADARVETDVPEEDLFAGVRELVANPTP